MDASPLLGLLGLLGLGPSGLCTVRPGEAVPLHILGDRPFHDIPAGAVPADDLTVADCVATVAPGVAVPIHMYAAQNIVFPVGFPFFRKEFEQSQTRLLDKVALAAFGDDTEMFANFRVILVFQSLCKKIVGRGTRGGVRE